MYVFLEDVTRLVSIAKKRKMKDRTFIIKRFEQIIEIGTTFGMNWFRGHSKVYGNLTPSIFRQEYWNNIVLSAKAEPEVYYYSEFIRKAPSITEKLPESNNYLEWLFLMQHHGLPTRLLDWTENILIATFFTVINHVNEDGELWTFLPWKLNEFHGFWGLPYPNNKILKFLSSEMFHSNPQKFSEELELETEPTVPMAILPALKHPRMTAQQSCFTIHPKPGKGLPLQEIISENNMLTRFIIPKKLKKDFKIKLSYLGVNHSTLFPDLVGLALSIKEKNNIVAWVQPDLPDYEKFEP